MLNGGVRKCAVALGRGCSECCSPQCATLYHSIVLLTTYTPLHDSSGQTSSFTHSDTVQPLLQTALISRGDIIRTQPCTPYTQHPVLHGLGLMNSKRCWHSDDRRLTGERLGQSSLADTTALLATTSPRYLMRPPR